MKGEFFCGLAGFVFVVLGFDAITLNARSGSTEIVKTPFRFNAGGKFVFAAAIKNGLVHASPYFGPQFGFRLFQGALRHALIGLRFDDLWVFGHRRTQDLRQVSATRPK